MRKYKRQNNTSTITDGSNNQLTTNKASVSTDPRNTKALPRREANRMLKALEILEAHRRGFVKGGYAEPLLTRTQFKKLINKARVKDESSGTYYIRQPELQQILGIHHNTNSVSNPNGSFYGLKHSKVFNNVLIEVNWSDPVFTTVVEYYRLAPTFETKRLHSLTNGLTSRETTRFTRLKNEGNHVTL